MNPRKVLLVRLDRIGDLILTLPVDQLNGFRGSDVTWVVTKGLGAFVEASHPKRKFFEFAEKFNKNTYSEFLKFLRQENFDAAIVFHAPWWISAALAQAGIPVRVGPQSQWHSFLFFNRGVRQKRSQAEFHEFDYNFQLVEKGLKWPEEKTEHDSLNLIAVNAAEILNSQGLKVGDYIVVHPGMGGSARNWPTEYYLEWMKRRARTTKLVVTGTLGDKSWLDPLKEGLKNETSIVWLDGKLKPKEWLAVLSGAKAVVAPSTGAIHAAASLSVPAIGIYCPVKVQAPKRWAPLGEKASALVPDVKCPGQHRCLMESCPLFDCMKSVTPDHVDREIDRLTRNREITHGH